MPEIKVFFAWIKEGVRLHHHGVVGGGAVHGGDHCPGKSHSSEGASKGRPHKEKHVFFRALPEKGGGFTHARIFWPFFHQEKVPKIGTFLLKTNDICMFFVIIIIKITIITNVIIIKTIIIINGIFFCHTRKTSF